MTSGESDSRVQGESRLASPEEKKGDRATVFIMITILIDSIGFGMIAPVMPELIQEMTGEGFAEAARRPSSPDDGPRQTNA